MCNQLREEYIDQCDENDPTRFTTCCLIKNPEPVQETLTGEDSDD